MDARRRAMSMSDPPGPTRPQPQQWAPPSPNLNPRPPCWNPPLRRGDRHTSQNAQRRAGEVSRIRTSTTTVPLRSTATATPTSPSGPPRAMSAPADPCATRPSPAGRTVVTTQPFGSRVSRASPTAKFLTRRSQTARWTEAWRSAAGHPSPRTGTTTAGSITGRTVHWQRSRLHRSIPVAAQRTADRSPGCRPRRTATTTGRPSVSRGTIEGSVWLIPAVRSTVRPRPPAPRCRCPVGPLTAPGGPVLLPPRLTSTHALSSIHCLGR